MPNKHSHGKSTISGGFNGKIIYKWVIFRVLALDNPKGQLAFFCQYRSQSRPAALQNSYICNKHAWLGRLFTKGLSVHDSLEPKSFCDGLPSKMAFEWHQWSPAHSILWTSFNFLINFKARKFRGFYDEFVRFWVLRRKDTWTKHLGNEGLHGLRIQWNPPNSHVHAHPSVWKCSSISTDEARVLPLRLLFIGTLKT